jgi:putative copper export protein
MPILLAGTTEFVHIEQVSALFKFRLGQVLLYNIINAVLFRLELALIATPTML